MQFKTMKPSRSVFSSIGNAFEYFIILNLFRFTNSNSYLLNIRPIPKNKKTAFNTYFIHLLQNIFALANSSYF